MFPVYLTEGYRSFLRYTADVFEHGFTRLAHVPFLDWWSMVRVAPQLVRLEAYRSVYSVVSSFIQDPHLRQDTRHQSRDRRLSGRHRPRQNSSVRHLPCTPRRSTHA